tara:strand:- start:6766 stop:8448 length:1683 start_codon:yes stop_codon:yes gene_type:complete
VVAGKIAACHWVRKACQRHLDDRAWEKDKAYLYRFDRDKAEKVCRFLELLPHVAGRWGLRAEKLRLEPWQAFLTCCVFGWVHRASGLRRFRKVFLLIPRKNGKSLLAAGWGLWMFAMDGEFGAQVYSGATSEKQAWEVFSPARLMALRTPALQSAKGISVNASNLHILATGSKFEPLIGKPGDGASPSCAIHDEYHEHDTDDQVDTMQTGMGARDQPLQIIVSTAGYNLSGPCYQSQLDLQKVLDGAMQDDELFGAIWSLDRDEDWTTEEALRKANPNYGVSVSGEFLRSQQRQAINSARKQGKFRTKHLNEWVSARAAYFNTQRWIEASRADITLDMFEGQPCRLGLDLASKVDIAALEILFDLETCERTAIVRRLIDDGFKHARFGRYYLPEAAVEAGENEAYRGWVIEDWITQTDGEIIDFEEIKADILDISSRFQVEDVAYDPHQATMLVTALMTEGVPVTEFRPTVLNFSEPMKTLDGMIRSRQIAHNGDPVMTWMISNVVAREDAKDNVYPRKDRVENKIDGVIALIMAKGRMMAGAGSPPIDLDAWLSNPVSV